MTKKLVHVTSLAVDAPWSDARQEPTGIPVVLRLFGADKTLKAFNALLTQLGLWWPPGIVVVPNFYFSFSEGELLPCAKLADAMPEAEWHMAAPEGLEPTVDNVVIFTVLEAA